MSAASLAAEALDSKQQREKFYGRRKGRPYKSSEREILERNELQFSLQEIPKDLQGLFSQPVTDIHLEIGFGAGEHLIAAAKAHPDIGFIGAEAYLNGIAKCALKARGENLANIRLWADDARPLLDVLPVSSLARIYLLYPDPWPKRRHWKRRFIIDENIARLARILREDGELRFATDWANYAAWALSHLGRSGHFVWPAEKAADWLKPWNSWPTTRYEQKAQRAGRKSSYLTFRRTDLPA